MNPELLRRLTAHARWLATRHPADLTTVVREAMPRLRVRAGHADLAAVGGAALAGVLAAVVAAVPASSGQQRPATARPTPVPVVTAPTTDTAAPSIPPPPTTTTSSPSPSRSTSPRASRSSARPGPLVLRATRVGGDDAQLSWRRPDNMRVTSYVVYRSGRQIARLGGNTTGYRVRDLPPGVHEFSVVAVGDDGTNRRSNSARVTIEEPEPTEPTPTPSVTP